MDGNAEERRALYASTRRGFLVTNYEQVVRDFDAIAAWDPDLVILDEAQRIKNWSTRTALTVKRLRPAYRLVLTGTPMENRLDELASIVEWVDDRALEPKWRLAPWHSSFADGKREVVGARNLGTLRARLAPVLLRRVRAEVLTQLPKRQDTVIPVDLTGDQREAHDELKQPIAKLQRAANACINLELPWNPAVLEQRLGRIHHLGQKRPIDVYNLVSRACIEERIAGIVSDKRALFRGLFEGSSDEIKLERSSSLLHVLERLVIPSAASTPPTEEPESSLDAPANESTTSEVEQMVDSAEPPRPDASELSMERAFLPPLLAAESTPLPVGRLFDALRVERGADGSLRIEAPPQAASALASLFDGMARLLSAVGSAQASGTEGPRPAMPS